jgi:hypothetical protein
MKLSAAAEICEANARYFTEVYKLFNYKDDDDLRAYCEFVIHEPVEWMRGFPAKWKTSSNFGRVRAAFHKLMKADAVESDLGADFCHRVHEIVWETFKEHMDAVLEKRNKGSTAAPPSASTKTKASDPVISILETFGDDAASDILSAPDSDNDSDSLDAESLPPPPPVPEHKPKNTVKLTKPPLDYKHKYESALGVLKALLSGDGDENTRLRAALVTLLQAEPPLTA